MSRADLRSLMLASRPQLPQGLVEGAAPAPKEDDVLSGLVMKSVESNPASKSYVAFPPEIADRFGISGVDSSSLSAGERVLLRRMGVSTAPPTGETPLRGRVAKARREAPKQEDQPANPSINWQQFLVVSGFGIPQPTHEAEDQASIWVHPRDIPEEVYASLTPEQRKNIPVAGMSIPYSKITPEDAAWLATRISEQRAQREAQASDDVQSDPKSLKKLMGQ